MNVMTPLTFDQIQLMLSDKYGEQALRAPDYFAELIPQPAPSTQAAEVQAAVQQLTGCDCSPDLKAMLSRWDFMHLNVAGFSFGFRGTFAERLVMNNQPDAANAWWEDETFGPRPPTRLFIAQSDPYVMVLDVQTDEVLAYIDDHGANTAVKIAGSLSMCLRMLSTVQVYKPADPLHGLTVAEIKDVLGEDCDEQFWEEQIRHWAQFN
jgi:hypothetical protein